MTVEELITTLQALPPGSPAVWAVAELTEAIPVLYATESALAALRLQAVAAFDAAGGGQISGHRSTADWLAHTTGISHPGGVVNTARALRDQLPATFDALAQGVIREDHVTVIRRGHRMFGDDFADIEAEVVEVARYAGVKELRRFIDGLVQQYAPDDFDTTTENAKAKRKLFLSQSLDGWWHVNGLLDPETGQRLRNALDVYADPTGPDDLRTPAARRADALAEIADKAVADIDRPSGRGQVLIRLTEEQLHTRCGVSWPGGVLMTRPDVEKMTCTADVATVTGALTADGVWKPLNLARTARYATAEQRLALQARDGDTCIHPTCTVPVNRCKAHHIRHWADGGSSDIENYAFACGTHHNDVHHGRLIITIRPDGSHTTTRRGQ